MKIVWSPEGADEVRPPLASSNAATGTSSEAEAANRPAHGRRIRCTIAMLSPFLARITLLTRLGVPSSGMRSAVLIHQVADQIGEARRPARGHFISSYAAIRRACASGRATSAGSFEFHSWSTSARARNSSASLSIRTRVASITRSPHRSCRTRHGCRKTGCQDTASLSIARATPTPFRVEFNAADLLQRR